MPAELHAHHAIQVSIGLSDHVQFRTDDNAPWVSFGAAIIPPDFPHIFQAPGKTIAHLFCDPESAIGRGISARFEMNSIMGMATADIEPHGSALRSAYNNQASEEELEHLALETLFALSGHLPVAAIDPRISQATAFMATRLADPLTLEDVARHVGLSPGRFRHLFVAETGIAFRSHLLWTRLNRALELGFSGMPWTEVAHATNFADSAHLSRTARRMYGIAPSSMRQEDPAASLQMTA